MQALGAFNFSHKVAFDQDTAHAPCRIFVWRLRPTTSWPICRASLPQPRSGALPESTNFAVMAMTGLDGYFSSETYSKFFAVPGLRGSDPADVLAQAEQLYEQRRDDVGSFVRGDITDAASARLAKDHVQWIVVSGDAMQEISTAATPWRKTREIAVYRLTQSEQNVEIALRVPSSLS